MGFPSYCQIEIVEGGLFWRLWCNWVVGSMGLVREIAMIDLWSSKLTSTTGHNQLSLRARRPEAPMHMEGVLVCSNDLPGYDFSDDFSEYGMGSSQAYRLHSHPSPHNPASGVNMGISRHFTKRCFHITDFLTNILKMSGPQRLYGVICNSRTNQHQKCSKLKPILNMASNIKSNTLKMSKNEPASRMGYSCALHEKSILSNLLLVVHKFKALLHTQDRFLQLVQGHWIIMPYTKVYSNVTAQGSSYIWLSTVPWRAHHMEILRNTRIPFNSPVTSQPLSEDSATTTVSGESDNQP